MLAKWGGEKSQQLICSENQCKTMVSFKKHPKSNGKKRKIIQQKIKQKSKKNQWKINESQWKTMKHQQKNNENFDGDADAYDGDARGQ